MRPVLTARSIRQAEQDWFEAHPGADLMQRAARAVTGAAIELTAEHERPRLLVVAGTGSNAGDALFAAAAVPGAEVSVWCPFDRTHVAGLRAALQAGAKIVSRAEALEVAADLVIDGLFGIGGRPGLPESVADFAEAVRRSGVPVLAVDLPSGLDADSGERHGCLPATVTVTFIALKPCHVLQPAAAQCGRVDLVDIGVEALEPVALALEEADVASRWPMPDETSDKYSRGVVGLDTGSSHYPGAGLLSTTGALHAGAGMVRHAGPVEVTERVLTRWPSVVIGAGRVQAWVCGPGWGDGDANASRLAARLADDLPTVVDADGLTVLKDLPRGSLLTPHAGELARLLGVERQAVQASPVEHAQRAADEHGCAVLLKGATQVCCAPGEVPLIAVPGPAWTGQAGSGDVLAGVCGTLLAAGLDARWAGAMAASLQAVAARRLPGPWPPDRLAEQFPPVIAEWSDQ